MKTGMVKLSQLREHDRWDARFHLVLSEISDKVEEVKSGVSAEWVLKFLESIRAEDLHAVDVLARGSYTRAKPNRRDLCVKYPYVCFVLVWRTVGKTQDRLVAQMTDNKRYLEKLKALEAAGRDL